MKKNSSTPNSQKNVKKTRRIIGALLFCAVANFLVGCASPRAEKQWLSDSVVEAEIRKHEDKIEAIIHSLRLTEKIKNRMLGELPEPPPQRILQNGDHARQIILPDKSYVDHLRCLIALLEQRLEAIAAEKRVLEAWLFADRFGSGPPQGVLLGTDEKVGSGKGRCPTMDNNGK